ncbi:CaiB/BaiF CoA-transferase family protein [Nocardioides sp. Arc9.136]|uniref:CaiB/BaiF CoA transferase family protein n=1 Tax=Nocardioides sp. Arc9.136 TaxID=2996826 RepID=UPI0026653B97|nr:CaiB/BaiF CoA-transferase family protein [Nocardioides sp. Arc9.136]WKN48755.1 CaiB/BaiF CoA-transferase family protein [Nocardioides sp. Arc9.136]
MTGAEDALELPLAGITVLDFSQFLAGPVAALRLGDLGARVIKVERPQGGDLGRTLAFGGLMAGDSSMSFHAMNRGKESLAADLKDPADLALVRDLVREADVVIQNFRPGVMERIGLDYDSVRELNPTVVYGSVSGYGDSGPFKDRPGQDLLAQSIAGLPWLNGSADDPPVPVGLAVADHLASCHLAQGITALLVRRFRTGRGGHAQTSLFEALLDLQFELLTTRLNDPTVAVQRKGPRSAHAFLSAPYGIYPTSDGFLAIAMNPVPTIGRLLGVQELVSMTDPSAWWERQGEIEELISAHLRTGTREEWLAVLDAEDVWCAPVLTLEELVEHDGFRAIAMTQELTREGLSLTTTRSPIRIDGRLLTDPRPAPRLGEHDAVLRPTSVAEPA